MEIGHDINIDKIDIEIFDQNIWIIIYINKKLTAIIAIKWSKPRIGCSKPFRTFAVPPTANA